MVSLSIEPIFRDSYPFEKAFLRDSYHFEKAFLKDSSPFEKAFLRDSDPFKRVLKVFFEGRLKGFFLKAMFKGSYPF